MGQKTLINLPSKVIFCRECVMSNQRPQSYVEFLHDKSKKGAKYLQIEEDGLCSPCKVWKINNTMDWGKRHKELLQLLDKHRKGNGEYDCLVPGSGGKDSGFVSHLLKYKYGMNPLTCTWPPLMYTDYGYKNYKNWLKTCRFENIVMKPKEYLMKYLTKMSILNLLHPFQTFIIGQKNIAPKVAAEHNIKLIFYGESESLYNNNPEGFYNSKVDNKYFSVDHFDKLILAGIKIKDLYKSNYIKKSDLSIFFPLSSQEIHKKKIEMHYFGYYQKWIPQEIYYYAFKNTGYRPRPFRTDGTFSKYSSIDDKIDDLHYYTMFIKFGIGRATSDASQEIRNYHLTREEGVNLVRKFDGEFPSRYFDEIIRYLEINKDDFFKTCDKHRSPHLWKKIKNKWFLKHKVK
jgi:N-acetyl sugar amidotransferase